MNPWSAIDDSPEYVLPEDRPYVEAFNAMLPKGDEVHRLMLDVPPSPINGRLDAKVVLLMANPLYTEQARRSFEDDTWRRAVLSELRAESERRFIALEDRWSMTQGGLWWRGCLGALKRSGLSWDSIGEGVMSVDFHGYFSHQWATPPVTLPSQRFGFGLVEAAVERGALVVILRAERYWKVAVPTLLNHPDRVFVARNPRSSAISPRNLPEGAFTRVVDRLRRGADG